LIFFAQILCILLVHDCLRPPVFVVVCVIRVSGF